MESIRRVKHHVCNTRHATRNNDDDDDDHEEEEEERKNGVQRSISASLCDFHVCVCLFSVEKETDDPREENRGKVSAGEEKEKEKEKEGAEEGREEGVCSVTHARVYEYMCI